VTENEIERLAEEIRIQKKKTIILAHKKNKNILQSMKKQTDKVKEGCEKLIEETEPKLTEEGMKKIKFRSQFESLKAINALSHFIKDQFSDFKVLKPSNELTSNELNQFIRVVSRLLNDVNKERSATDRIMGIDYMIKKRTIYSPLGKLSAELAKLRDLQKEEFRIIKALEDLEELRTDIKELSEKITKTETDIQSFQKEYQDLEKRLGKTERERIDLLENPLIKNFRSRGVRMTELEIEIGRHLNSFKKIFKKYAREIQRGSISGDFGLVNTALAYEKNPVQSFLKEEEGNPEIIALLEELTKVGLSDLHLKQKDINNLNQELKAIQQERMDSWKAEWKKHFKDNEKLEDSGDFKSINEKLNRCEKKLETLKVRLDEKEEEINLNKKKLTQYSESLNERHQRAKDIAKEVLEMED
jgi:chromosome segregation ATPase